MWPAHPYLLDTLKFKTKTLNKIIQNKFHLLNFRSIRNMEELSLSKVEDTFQGKGLKHKQKTLT